VGGTRAATGAAVFFAVLMVAAACGSSSKGSTGSATSKPVSATTTAPANLDKSLGTGVTPTSVKLGVVMIDYNCIKQFVDTVELEQQPTFQVFVNDINSHGGIDGRQISPVYKSYCPIQSSEALSTCTSLTEDSHVFAVVGTLFDASGDAQLCFTNQHKTPLITDSLTQSEIAKAKPGLLLTPDITPERRVRVIMSLLKTQGTLQGKKVAILADSSAKPEIDSTIAPGLKALGVERGSDAVLTINGTDTSNAQAQLDSFIERWKTENVNALVLAGGEVSSKQFVEKVRRSFPNITLVADTTDVLSQAQDESKAGVKPNPYDGIITAEGDTGVEHQTRASGKYCRDIWEAATHKTMPSPLQVIPAAGGKRDDLYDEIDSSCAFLTMFKTIATKVGPYLNATNWTATVNNYGPIFDTSTVYASLHQGKYDADDTYGLVAYDPSVGQVGDWRRITAVQNVANS
jgi:ABC-type branched-subunit amino acid transport system substrate-binding protein